MRFFHFSLTVGVGGGDSTVGEGEPFSEVPDLRNLSVESDFIDLRRNGAFLPGVCLTGVSGSFLPGVSGSGSVMSMAASDSATRSTSSETYS
jgi:hypothetical protein